MKPHRALRGVFVVFAAFALGCASGSSEPHAKATSAATHEPEGAFPPVGAIVLKPSPPPAEGTLYQILTTYDGRTEVSEEGPGAHDDATSVDEEWALQIDYRVLPVTAPEGSLATSLVLEALKRRQRLQPPGKQHVVEIGDDRLRVSQDDKVSTDLRGAQPKEDLTPRALLQKSFALMVTDAQNNPTGFTVRALPSAKKILGSMYVREPLTYLSIAYPDRPVAPGDTWHAKRYFANPVGRLGLGVDIEMRLVGYERIGEAPCARVSLRASMDSHDVKSDAGSTLDEVRYTLQGDAWLDLRSGQVALARIEDVSAVSQKRTGEAMTKARVRMRFNSRSVLERLDAMPDSARWADGTKRFSAVK